MNYYISFNGAQQGPFPVDQLAAQGLRPDTLVWGEGMPQWERADRVPALQPILAQAAAAGGAAPQAAQPGQPYQAGPAYAAPGVAPAYATPGTGPVNYGGYPGGPMAPTPADVSNKKMAAGICGILWGSLGVHKYILGYNTAGTIMLLVTLLTCGIGGIVMHVISIVEGIMYLSKTDAEFYQTYMVQKKEWF